MTITAQQVKELRELTGAGILDAKKALVEVDGDLEKAMELLRQKGMASADKKMSRIAAEGIVYSYVGNNVGAMVEVNCETDFVAKNEDFKTLVDLVAKTVADNNPADLEILNDLKPDGTTIETLVKEAISTIGEKITIRRFVRFEGSIATYIHNNKIGVLLEVEGDDTAMAKDICLHIASSGSEFVSRAEIPQSVIDEETRIEMGKEDLASKPEQIRAKIVEGRVNKLMSQRVLLEQSFVKNPDLTIEQLIAGKLTIKRFAKYTLGEGIEKKSENFAEEVMNQINK